ncbi:MAG TPA: ABC transporter substrate-binding protein [Coleofasciculaceae cyanobacterium]
MGNRFQDAPLLAASLVVSLALLGGGYWLVKSNGLLADRSPMVSTTPSGPPPSFSAGEQVLLVDSPDKLAAVAARRSGDGAEAIALLQKSLRNRPNDPEALIYLNNWQTADQPQRTIAVAVPATTLPDVAKELLRGVAEAQTRFNQQASGNWRLRVEIADDSNHPGTSQAVAQDLVKDPAVLGVVGHFSSTTSLAAAKIYQEAGLPMISPSSTAVGLSDLGDAILRTVPSDRQAGQALAMVARQQLKLQRVAVFFNPKSAYSQSLKTEFVQQFSADGQGEVQLQEIGPEPIDAQRVLEQVRANNNQGVVLFGQRPVQTGEGLVLLGDRQTLPSELAIVEANRRRLPILSGDSLYSIDLLKLGASAQDTILAIPWHADLPQSAAFVKATRRRWGGDVSWRTAMAYDATQALIAAIAGETTRSGVRQALHRPGFQATGASAPVRFSATGDRALPLVLITVRPGNRSGTGFDFGLLK